MAIYREGISASLDDEPDLDVAGTSRGLCEALTAATEGVVDLCILDSSGYRQDELDLFFLGMAKLTPIVVIGVPLTEPDILACLDAGAVGYVTRDASLGELVSVVRRTLENGACVRDVDLVAVLNHFRSRSQPRREGEAVVELPMLSPRECDVAALLAENLTNAQIAHKLGISVHTAKHHVRSVLQKFGMSRRSELLARGDYVARLVERSRGLDPIFRS